MTKFIFHGGAVKIISDSNKRFYQEMIKDTTSSVVILCVYFATRDDDYSEQFEYDKVQFQNQASKKDLEFIVATQKDFLSQIKKSDVIFFRGGSTLKLQQILQSCPPLADLFLGKTIAGSSAGAYVLSTYYPSHYDDIILNGLGIVPVRVVTHYKSDKMSPKIGALQLLEKTALELPLIKLRESEWQVFLK